MIGLADADRHISELARRQHGVVATRQLLAGLAAEKGGEVTVKARVVESGGNKILVLAGEGGAKGGKKK